MSYNYGMDFGYDQIFTNSELDDYTCFSSNSNKNINNSVQNINDKLLLNKLKEMDKKEELQKYLESEAKKEHFAGNSVSSNGNNGCNSSNCNCNKDIKYDMNNFKKSLDELQRKNDMLTIFIIFLVIFFVMQYGSDSHNNANKYIIPVQSVPNIGISPTS